jgi:hypothetical protein
MKYIKEIKQTETNKYKLKIRKHYLKDKQILNLIHQDFYNINSVEIIKKMKVLNMLKLRSDREKILIILKI